MNEIIDSLSEIEAAAIKIMENVNSQKTKLAKEAEQKKAAFDKYMEQDTAKKIASMQKDMEVDIQQELKKLKKNTETTLQNLEQDYQQNHVALAKNIVNKMSKV